MRLLLLLLFAAFTAIAIPFVVDEVNHEVLPGKGAVGRAWGDAQEIARLLRENWNRPPGSPEPSTSEPIFEDQRLLRTASVVGLSTLWFLTFSFGGIAGLALLAVRTSTLLVLGAFVLFAGYSCTSVQVKTDFTPEVLRGIKAALALAFAGILSGFLFARGFRATTA